MTEQRRTKDELVEMLKKELGLPEITWKEDKDTHPHFETETHNYMLIGNGIFEVDKKTRKMICYDCKSRVKIQVIPRDEGGKVRQEINCYCPNCQPEQQSPSVEFYNRSEQKGPFAIKSV